MELLTSSEVAGYVRLKEGELYELVATGALPCTKVTGRWLFPKAELHRWVIDALVQPADLMPAELPQIVGGSHDPLLERTLRESGSALATLPPRNRVTSARTIRGNALHADGSTARYTSSPRFGITPATPPSASNAVSVSILPARAA